MLIVLPPKPPPIKRAPAAEHEDDVPHGTKLAESIVVVDVDSDGLRGNDHDVDRQC